MITAREQELFARALRLSADERTAWIQRECAGDTALRGRLETRLRAHDATDATVAGETTEGIILPDFVPIEAETTGTQIGRYKLLEKLGEGGFGSVWAAEQREPVRRRVALKIIKLGMDTKQVVGRFEAERQALALMDHPNMSKVLDAGATEAGRPYFVMELVRGNSITKYCDENQLPTADRIVLLIKVCQAIQHAHQKGIIHRDLKPSNILVTVNDGVPVPKVIDFGIAKATQGDLTDKTVYTQLQQFIGTPAYMSPEQAGMSGLDIDTRSDIYSLGVVLYEMLTGTTPFDPGALMKAGVDGMRQTIREQEPVSPSTRLRTLGAVELTESARRRGSDAPRLVSQLRGDLDWIVMKCLEKDRGRRYETANGLAADLQRFLDNEPVLARPPSQLYRIQKSIRRNKLFFAAAAAVFAALLAGVTVSTWQWFRAAAAEREQSRLRAEAVQNANVARAEAQKSREVAGLLKDMLRGVGPSVAQGRDAALLREILQRTQQRLTDDKAILPEVEAELRLALAATYRDLGDFAEGAKNARRALELRQLVFGADHLAVADALNEAAKAANFQNDLPEAERLQRLALQMHSRLDGAETLAVGNMHNDLGIILWRAGRLKDARTELELGLAIREKHLRPPHQWLADNHLNLSVILFALGELSRSEEEARLAAAGYRELFTENHPNLGMALHNRAKALREMARTDEAEAVLNQALSVYQAAYQGDHLYVAEALDDLGLTLQRRGDAAGAADAFRRALAMSRATGGEADPQTLLAMRHLALVLAGTPDQAEGAELVGRAVELGRSARPTKPAAFAEALADAGQFWIKAGQPARAEAPLLDAHRTLADAGLTGRPLQRACRDLEQLYIRLNRPEEAKQWAAKLAAAESRP
ncbi:MAG: protein kinase domain-containing protein [Limisphaerales bacterium]